MILGYQSHVIRACMKEHDLGTRKHENGARWGVVRMFRIVRARSAEQSVCIIALKSI